jgi:hypothetical protein
MTSLKSQINRLSPSVSTLWAFLVPCTRAASTTQNKKTSKKHSTSIPAKRSTCIAADINELFGVGSIVLVAALIEV